MSIFAGCNKNFEFLMLLIYKKKYERFHVNGHTTALSVHTQLMKKYKSFKFSPVTTMQRLFTGKRKRH